MLSEYQKDMLDQEVDKKAKSFVNQIPLPLHEVGPK